MLDEYIMFTVIPSRQLNPVNALIIKLQFVAIKANINNFWLLEPLSSATLLRN